VCLQTHLSLWIRLIGWLSSRSKSSWSASILLFSGLDLAQPDGLGWESSLSLFYFKRKKSEAAGHELIHVLHASFKGKENMKRKLKRNDDYLVQRRKLLWIVDGCWRLRLRRELLLLLLIAHGVVQGRINWGRDAGCVVHSWSCYFVQRWCCSATRKPSMWRSWMLVLWCHNSKTEKVKLMLLLLNVELEGENVDCLLD